MDGWSNNSAYTSGNSSSGGFGNSGSSATSNGYGSSSSDYSNSSSNDSSYWSGVYGNKTSSADAWKNNTAYTAGPAGTFGTTEHLRTLQSAIEDKRATPGQLETAKAMVAGKQTVDGVGAAQGILNTIGAGFGLVGMAGSKALGWAAEKGVDAVSGYDDNAAYAQSKQLAKKDSSLVGTLIGMAAPSFASGPATTLAKNNAGGYNEGVNNLSRSLIDNGYSKSNQSMTPISSGSSTQPSSLLKNMQTAQQAQTTDSEINNNPLSLTYDNNFNFYSGTVM